MGQQEINPAGGSTAISLRDPVPGFSQELRISIARKFASIAFGVVYGGCLLNGFEDGLNNVLNSKDFSLIQWPLMWTVSDAVIGFLAGYCSQSWLSGVAALAVSPAIFYLMFGQAFPFISPSAVMLMLVAGATGAFCGQRLRLSEEDAYSGRLLGISWAHWLWLWLPFRLIIAEAVWAVYPLSLMPNSPVPRGWVTLIRELWSAPFYLALLVCALIKALKSIQARSELTRLQSALRFASWICVFPVLVRILKLLHW